MEHIELTEQEFQFCTEFAKKSAATQREYRSGGSQTREVSRIFLDTQRGKLGEVIFKKFLEVRGIQIKLDFDIYPRGKWDIGDIRVNDCTVAIKSSKHFARWLLLETKDLERGEISDFYVLVMVDEGLHGGTIAGYITKKIIFDEKDINNHWLKKGELIPGTQTPLDAPNYAREAGTLLKTERDWDSLINFLTGAPLP